MKNNEKVDLTLDSIEFERRYGRKKTISIFTLGCKTNQYETDALMDLFYNNRYEIAEFDDFANIYVINTCTVTNVGDKKSRQMIRRAKKNNPDATVVVVGCYAQISPDEVAEIEDVDIVIGTDARSGILEYIHDYQNNETPRPYIVVKDIMAINAFEEMSVKHIKEHTRAFIKIQEGCNQFCSYCIIPYARGRVRSRAPENIIGEIENLVEQGYREFVLTGIHIGSYGLDFDRYKLIDLIEAIEAVEGVVRIRLGSIEPRLIDEDFVRRLKALNKVCDHFHLSMQSGSDTVLKRMNRKYTSEEYYRAVCALREIYPAPAITTDVIVGFPDETDREFEETYDFVEKVNFSEIHVFKFSKRQGTPAAKMENQVSGELKKLRSERLIALGEQLTEKYNQSYMGKTLEVLIEEFKEGFWVGHTTNYMKVKFPGNLQEKLAKKIVSVHVDQLLGQELIGSQIASND